jgi:hypothetical protein
LRRGFLFIALLLALTWFVLSQTARAVTPPPDGGYPGGNTAEGNDALFSLTTGTGNTATGARALISNTNGFANTASGASALYSNAGGSYNTASGYNALLLNTANYNTASGAQLFSTTQREATTWPAVLWRFTTT